MLMGVQRAKPFAGARGVLASSLLAVARSRRRVRVGVQRAKPFAGARGVLASSFLPAAGGKRDFATALYNYQNSLDRLAAYSI